VRVSVVVPAYNEAARIGAVIGPVLAWGRAHEVVVVDDGSSDGTAEAAAQAGARVVRLERNVGKGGAVARAISETTGDILIFLDADLIGLTPEHLALLLNPVAEGDADMTLGIFSRGRAATDLAQAITPWLSGQRAVRRDTLVGLDAGIARFGLEAALTRYARRAGLRVRQVTLPDLTHVMKEEKMGAVRGVISRLRMYRDILRSLVSRD
jgi:glycosyltransferase involved in cell wall biosynthesis